MESINPYNLKVIASYQQNTTAQITQILANIAHTYHDWKNKPFSIRAEHFQTLAELLRTQSKRLGTLATLEMGKPLNEAIAEVEKCAWVCEYYAEHAEHFLADETLTTDYKRTIISYEPLGAILGVMPWNYPFWQVFRFAVPTIMAGNVAILKHASNVPQCAEAIEELFVEAGFPNNVFTTLLIDSEKVESLIKSDIVQAISLTGSEKAGAAVSSIASKEIKKSLLELGGSDVFIVLNDSAIDVAAEYAIKGRFKNNGQSCIASKRFLIQEEVYDDFMSQFVEKVKALRIGDPMLEDTDIGPLAKKEFVDTLHEQVQKSVNKGARILVGGKISGDKDQFYEPTILTDVTPGMPAFDEELFGPVAACMKFSDVEEAIELANHSSFGLGGSIWTKNIKLGETLARQIVTGTVAINDITTSDPRIPFGGVKKSGFGRELAKNGIMEFVNKKAINIQRQQTN